MDDAPQVASRPGQSREEAIRRGCRVDECYVGWHEAGLRDGHQFGFKAPVVAALEVRGAGSGRVRLQAVDDASADTLCEF
jgi:hypothetical protein